MAKLKLTDELQDEICNDIKAGVPIIHASIAHGISQSTFYDWYGKGKDAKRKTKFRDFYEAVEEAKSVAITLRARRIYKAGEENWQADAWWLERVDPDNFGRREFHKHEAKVETMNVEPTDTLEMIREVDEELADLYEPNTEHTDSS